MADGLGSILGAIANPQVADIYGRFQQGRLGEQLIQQQGQQLQAGQQRMQQQGQAFGKEQEAAQLRDAGIDAVAAFGMTGEDRQRFLSQMQQKFASNPALSEAAGGLIGKPDSETDGPLLEFINMLTSAGIIPGGGKAEKTAKQIEREVGVKEKEAETNRKKLELKKEELEQRKKESEMGKLPIGFRVSKKGEAEPIPGSPQAVKREEEINKIATSNDFAKQQQNLINNLLSDARSGVSFFSTGVPGVISGSIPGSDAYNLDQTLETIKANLGFDKLQKMREASPTGGALGQVSERELMQLERAVSSLNRKQDQKQLRKNLNRVKLHYDNWFKNQQKAAKRQANIFNVEIPPVVQAQEQNAPQQALDFLRNNPNYSDQFKQKYGYIPEGL